MDVLLFCLGHLALILIDRWTWMGLYTCMLTQHTAMKCACRVTGEFAKHQCARSHSDRRRRTTDHHHHFALAPLQRWEHCYWFCLFFAFIFMGLSNEKRAPCVFIFTYILFGRRVVGNHWLLHFCFVGVGELPFGVSTSWFSAHVGAKRLDRMCAMQIHKTFTSRIKVDHHHPYNNMYENIIYILYMLSRCKV